LGRKKGKDQENLLEAQKQKSMEPQNPDQKQPKFEAPLIS